MGDGELQALTGAWLVIKLGRMDLRLGTHVGLTEAAPDFVASFWISGVLPLR